MWFNKDGAGILMFLFSYALILMIDIGVWYVALYELFKVHNPWAYIIASTYQILVGFIIWAHVAWMTCDPGWLPKDQKELNVSLLDAEIAEVYKGVEEARRHVEEEKAENESEGNEDTRLLFSPNQTKNHP
jgi:hypothetical protein